MEDTIIIDGLEIWPKDLGKMPWQEATTEVAKLGPGWRLPTIEELRYTLYPSRSGILGLDVTGKYYWSSTENDNYNAWYFYFTNEYANSITNKSNTGYVRAVRDFTWEAALEYLLKDF